MKKQASVRLDGHLQSTLDWRPQRHEALTKIAQGYRILWELDCGLFSDLTYPLNNQTQFLAFGHALDHFRDTLWSEFSAHSIGLNLYRGSADFRKGFHWDVDVLQEWIKNGFETPLNFKEEVGIDIADFQEINSSLLSQTVRGERLLLLFCCDTCAQFTDLLVRNVPDAIPLFLNLDVTDFQDPLLIAELTSRERWERFQLLNFEITKMPTIGVCLPSSLIRRPSQFQGLAEIMHKLKGEGIAYKVIPESYLTAEWDGLDLIYYTSKGMTPAGERMLKGFCAAGGTIQDVAP